VQSARGGSHGTKRVQHQFTEIGDACALAQAIVDTVREPVLVFDKDLRVIAASRSFYAVFKVSPQTPKAGVFTSWEMANGTFQSFGCCWKKSYPSMG
jgi:PAS domain-containing protein